MSISSCRPVAALAALLALAAAKTPAPDFSPTRAPEPLSAPANGAIFQAANGYAPLTSGSRATMVGDVLTIVLVENMKASKSTSQTTSRNGSIGLSPPTTGPFALFSSGDIGSRGSNAFKGSGDAAQSNVLSGEISVTVAAVYPNRTMLVRGEKLVTLNRGDEFVRFSGLVREADVGNDNRVASTRVADARVSYTGKGEMARASRQGWLQRFFTRISPF